LHGLVGFCKSSSIAAALERGDRQKFVYLFDEPTTGLHTQDVQNLMNVLQDLVDEKNSVILVEHNVDVWLAADWIVDLGPGGGDDGGKLVAEGPPRNIAQTNSPTGRILSRYIEPGRES
jgi:excinuclease ABC subunit A